MLAGLLHAAAFPKIGLHFLSWISLVPLVVFMFRSGTPAASFWGGAGAGFVQFFLLLVWIPDVLTAYGNLPAAGAWASYTLLISFLACFPGASCCWTRWLMARNGERWVFSFPLSWLALEYLRGFIPFGGFPWLLAGYSQTENLPLIQVADLFGVYGVSFLVILSNTSLAWVWRVYPRRREMLVPVLACASVVLGCYLYGGIMIRRWSASGPRFTAALLQGNLPMKGPAGELERKFRDGYVRMADHVRGIPIDLTVLPESPSPLIFESDPDYRRSIQDLARRYPLGLVFSNIAYERDASGERYFNSAYFLDSEGRETGRYDKIHLVPFGEYVPWSGVFRFMQSVTQEVSDFTPGRSYETISLRGHPSSALICFEAIFPSLVRRFVRDGSTLLINLTNDAWYGESAAPYQHLAMARWRAIENRRYLLRAANSGISAIIEPTGRIQASTVLLREEVCVGRFDFIEHQTWYARFGEVFPIACVIMIFAVSVWSFRRNPARFRHESPGG